MQPVLRTLQPSRHSRPIAKVCKPCALDLRTARPGACRTFSDCVRFESEGRIGWGAVRGDGLQLLCANPVSTGDFIRSFDAEHFQSAGELAVPLAGVKILSPITRDQQFICLGANYRQHMIESGIDPDMKRFNMVFTKSPRSNVPFDSQLVKPRCVRFLDYEIELGLVIKKAITQRITVTEDNLGDYVAGIVMLNDYSARDIQILEGQFYKGKSFRTFAPIGPHLCLLQRDEMHYLRLAPISKHSYAKSAF